MRHGMHTAQGVAAHAVRAVSGNFYPGVQAATFHLVLLWRGDR